MSNHPERIGLRQREIPSSFSATAPHRVGYVLATTADEHKRQLEVCVDALIQIRNQAKSPGLVAAAQQALDEVEEDDSYRRIQKIVGQRDELLEVAEALLGRRSLPLRSLRRIKEMAAAAVARCKGEKDDA